MKKILALTLMVSACLAIGSQSYAATDNEDYTVTIPTASNVVLTAAATNFGAITTGQFGVDDTAAHTILVGNGVVATSTSYVESNDSTAGAKQYTLTFAPSTGATATTVATDGANAKLTLASAGASVEIRLENSAKNAYPKLGAGTPVAFAVSGNTLNIAASSSVPFDATTRKAPLDMLMDLNESTVTMADAAGSMTFTMTLTAVGL